MGGWGCGRGQTAGKSKTPGVYPVGTRLLRCPPAQAVLLTRLNASDLEIARVRAVSLGTFLGM